MFKDLGRRYRDFRWRTWGLWLPLVVMVVGIIVTVTAIKLEPTPPSYVLDEAGKLFVQEPAEKSKLATYVEWAHHFGPELIVLFLAAVFVEVHVSKREQRNALRLRLVDGLRDIIRFCEDRSGFFTGDSIMTLENERQGLINLWENRGKGLKKLFTDREYELFTSALDKANDVLGRAQGFAVDADKWLMDGARLRVQVLKRVGGYVSWDTAELFRALDQQARTLLLVGQSLDPKEERQDVIRGLRALIHGPQMAQLPPGTAKEFRQYLLDLVKLLRYKQRMVQPMTDFRKVYSKLRDTVWKATNPNEL